MLEKALSEVKSPRAIREINCAIASIERMREIIMVDKRPYKKSKHGKGVYVISNGKKWVAKLFGKYIGTFETEELAVEAAEEYRKNPN